MVVVAGGVGEGDTDGGMSVSGNNHKILLVGMYSRT